MLMKTLPILVALAVPAVAHADAPARDTYVAVGTGLVIGQYLDAGISLEVARQLSDSPVYLHGLVGGGRTSELFDSGTGSFQQARVGVELDECGLDHRICAFGGLDLGLLNETFTDDDEMTTNALTPMVLPRLGVEAGSKTLRVRAELDYEPQQVGALQLALAYHF